MLHGSRFVTLDTRLLPRGAVTRGSDARRMKHGLGYRQSESCRKKGINEVRGSCLVNLASITGKNACVQIFFKTFL